MVKQGGFAVIKIGGLALGIASCLLITLFIKDIDLRKVDIPRK